MTKQIAKAAVDTAAYEAEVELRDDYSGRGMYGEECWAVVGDSAELATFEANLAKAATMEQLGETTEASVGNVEAILDTFMAHLEDIQGRRREDSMGMNRVWYYPSIKLED